MKNPPRIFQRQKENILSLGDVALPEEGPFNLLAVNIENDDASNLIGSSHPAAAFSYVI